MITPYYFGLLCNTCLLLRRTTVGFVFVCAKYKCDKERPMGRASPRVTSLAVMSADGSHRFPLSAKIFSVSVPVLACMVQPGGL